MARDLRDTWRNLGEDTKGLGWRSRGPRCFILTLFGFLEAELFARTHRHGEREPRSLPDLTLDPDLAAVQLDKLA